MSWILWLWPLAPLAALNAPRATRKSLLAASAAAAAGWLATLAVTGFSPTWVAGGASLAAAFAFAVQAIVQSAGESESDADGAKWRAELERLEAERTTLRDELDSYEREDAHAFQVYSLAKSLTETVSWNSLVTRFAQVLQNVTGSSDFLLYLTNDAGQLDLQAQNGVWHKETLPQAPAPAHPQWVPRGRETLLQVPLWQERELLGVLWTRWSNESHPSVNEVETIFEHLLTGFQKAKLFARMESLSRNDGLTGVLRRQTFLDYVHAEWTRARQFKTTFSFMLVDVDHFKLINDKYGHPGGDAVLAKLGEILRRAVYETDHVGRYGGEEFGVLLSRTDPEGVRRKAETIRARVEAEAFNAGWEKVGVTISIGVAHFPRDGQTVADVLESADRALYAAKRGGRNRVVDSAEAGR